MESVQLTDGQHCFLQHFIRNPVEINNKMNKDDDRTTVLTTIALLIEKLLVNFEKENIPVTEAFLNGSAASHILYPPRYYSDLDFTFPINLPAGAQNEEQTTVMGKILKALKSTLRELQRSDVTEQEREDHAMERMYFSKKYFHCKRDCWALYSLHNGNSCNIELKFVHKMERTYEFAPDSMKILLNPALRGEKAVVTSDFEDLTSALEQTRKFHLEVIDPENIFGGGLMKYILMLTRGYTPKRMNMEKQKLMVGRFLSNYEEMASFSCPVVKYLDNHFREGCKLAKLKFLKKLRYIVYSTFIESSVGNVEFLVAKKEQVTDIIDAVVAKISQN